MIAGILLAAGEGHRLGGGKLLRSLPDGSRLGPAAARTLAAGGLDRGIAVIRPGDEELASLLEEAGLEVLSCSAGLRGMGASLAAGVAETARADGWVIALGDMPWIDPGTVAAVAEALRAGARLAVPCHEGRGGHPVGFSAALGGELRALEGEAGARGIVDAHRSEATRVPVADPGILRDVDHPADLSRS